MMVSIFILMNIDILIFHVKKDIEKSYKIYCEYEIKRKTNDSAAPCGNQKSLAPLSGACHPPPRPEQCSLPYSKKDQNNGI
jgi:hypothetical protein